MMFDAASSVWTGLAVTISFGASKILGSRMVKVPSRAARLTFDRDVAAHHLADDLLDKQAIWQFTGKTGVLRK